MRHHFILHTHLSCMILVLRNALPSISCRHGDAIISYPKNNEINAELRCKYPENEKVKIGSMQHS